MFAQSSRANLSRPMSVPPGSPRQPAGGGGKGGGAGSQAAGSPGKGGGGRPMQAFGNINKLNTDIGSSGLGQAMPFQRPMADMFSAASNMFGNQNANVASVETPRWAEMSAPQPMPSMPPSIPTPSPQQPIPRPINPTVGPAQPLPYMPPSQPSPQMPGLQTQLSNFNPRASVPTPSPQTLTPIPGFQPQQAFPPVVRPSPQIPQLPAGLMQRLQSFGGF